MRIDKPAALFISVGLTLLLAACSTSEKTAAVTPTPLTGVSIESLIRTPGDEPFAVNFAHTRGAPGGATGIFVWRQGGGRRRWDAVSAPAYANGWFVSDDNFPAGVESDPASGRDCTWDGLRNGASVQVPFVECGGDKTGIGLMGAISSTLAGRVSRRIANRTIDSISTDCYSNSVQFRKSESTLCVDAARKVPLAFEGTDGEEIHAIEAVDVTASPEPLSVVINDPSTAAVTSTTYRSRL